MATLNDFGYNTMRVNGAEAKGQRPLVIILAEAHDKPLAHDYLYYLNLIFNGPKSVNNYFLDNSKGRFSFKNGGVVGPLKLSEADAALVVEPLLDRIKDLAIQTGFNFAAFETDNNNVVEDKELMLLIISNLGDTGGANRGSISPRKLSIDGLSMNVSAAAVDHRASFTTFAHELSHSLGTIDIYFKDGAGNIAATLMGATIFGGFDNMLSFHLDPWHKMVLGWVEPELHDIREGGGTVSLTVPGAGNASRPVLLYDSDNGLNEFLLLEYRSRSSAHHSSFDADVADSGLVIWHVIPNGIANVIPKVFVLGAPDFERGLSVFWHSGTATNNIPWYESMSRIRLKVHPFRPQDDTILVDILSVTLGIPQQDTPYVYWLIEKAIGVDFYGRFIYHPPKPEVKEIFIHLALYEIADTLQQSSKDEIQRVALKGIIRDVELKLKNIDERG